jgi:TonB family protein
VATDPINKQAQRLWPRWFIAGTRPVKVDLGPAGSGPLVDISGGGFRVQSLAPLRRGAEVPIRIDVPDRPQGLQCSGVVVWSKPNGAAGVRFAGLNDDQKAILHGWLAELEHAATAPSQSHLQDEFTSVVSQIRGAQLNSGDALNLIVRKVKDLNSVSGAAIALGTPENMVCMAAVGEAPQMGSTIPAVIGLTGECVFKRKTVHCEDSKNDPRVGRDMTFGSAVILPLVVNNEVRGVVQAYSKRSFAFTSMSIDALEKMADAVVFITFGIVTQRRLAMAKSSMPTNNTGSLGPKPTGASSLSMTGSWTAPAMPASPTFSTRPADPVQHSIQPVHEMPQPVRPAAAAMSSPSATASSAPVAEPTIPRYQPEPLATSIAEPIAAPVPAPIRRAPERRAPVAGKSRNAPRRPEHHVAAASPTGKWIVIAAAVLIVAGGPSWYYLQHHRAAVPVASAAEPPSETFETAQATHPELTAPVTSAAFTVTPKTSATTVVTPHTSTAAEHVSSQPAKHDETRDVAMPPVSAAPPPAPEAQPMVLASTPTKSPKGMDLDAVVPVKLPSAIPVEAAPAQIALPAMSKDVPKLAAPMATVRIPATLIKRVNPTYPPMAKNAHMQGVVELAVQITKDGSVAQVRRLTGQPILAGAAIEAVKQWKYDPAKVNGQPVETETTVKLDFELYH